MCGSQKTIYRSPLFDHVGQTQIVRYGSTCLYSLSNFADPFLLIRKELCFTDEKIASRTGNKFIITALTGIYTLSL